MSDFETEIMHGLENNDKQLLAIRRRQANYTQQVFDVISISPKKSFNLGIEAKSISTEKGAKKLYFSRNFKEKQIERTTRALEKSGLNGLLAVRLRRGKGRKTIDKAIPWYEVLTKLEDGGNGFSVEEIKTYPSMQKIYEHGFKYFVNN